MNRNPRLPKLQDRGIVIEVENVHKSYDGGLVPALHGITLLLKKGRTYALMGPSGCGKSTLLNIIGTLDRPSSGTVKYFGQEISSEEQCLRLRRQDIGFVFQFHNLLPLLTLAENVELPLLSNGRIGPRERRQRVSFLLKAFGLGSKMHHYASRVSGGERQRAAIARALVNDPKLVLADEPTGNVDSGTANRILHELITYTNRTRATLLITTHDEQIAKLCTTVIRMKDGRILSPGQRSKRACADASICQPNVRFLRRR